MCQTTTRNVDRFLRPRFRFLASILTVLGVASSSRSGPHRMCSDSRTTVAGDHGKAHLWHGPHGLRSLNETPSKDITRQQFFTTSTWREASFELLNAYQYAVWAHLPGIASGPRTTHHRVVRRDRTVPHLREVRVMICKVVGKICDE